MGMRVGIFLAPAHMEPSVDRWLSPKSDGANPPPLFPQITMTEIPEVSKDPQKEALNLLFNYVLVLLLFGSAKRGHLRVIYDKFTEAAEEAGLTIDTQSWMEEAISKDDRFVEEI